MSRHSCQPDVVSYTALITAYGRGGQWRRALDAFARMQRARCVPDHVVYEAVIEVLWETGGAPNRVQLLYRALKPAASSRPCGTLSARCSPSCP